MDMLGVGRMVGCGPLPLKGVNNQIKSSAVSRQGTPRSTTATTATIAITGVADFGLPLVGPAETGGSYGFLLMPAILPDAAPHGFNRGPTPTRHWGIYRRHMNRIIDWQQLPLARDVDCLASLGRFGLGGN